MTSSDIVRTFVDDGAKAQLAGDPRICRSRWQEQNRNAGARTVQFSALDLGGGGPEARRDEAYRSVYEMQRNRSAYLALPGGISKRGTQHLLGAAHYPSPASIGAIERRAIAKGDFTQRVHIKTRTEIGETGNPTFNTMSEELEQFVEDLKRAAEENKALFMGSIQMLGGRSRRKRSLHARPTPTVSPSTSLHDCR